MYNHKIKIILKSLKRYSFLSLLFGTLIYQLPVVSNTLWEQMKEIEGSISVSDVHALNDDKISDQTKVDIFNICLNQMNNTDEIEFKDSNSETFQTAVKISKTKQIQKNCSGKVGESTCLEEGFKTAVNNCASSIIIKNRIKKSL